MSLKKSKPELVTLYFAKEEDDDDTDDGDTDDGDGGESGGGGGNGSSSEEGSSGTRRHHRHQQQQHVRTFSLLVFEGRDECVSEVQRLFRTVQQKEALRKVRQPLWTKPRHR